MKFAEWQTRRDSWSAGQLDHDRHVIGLVDSQTLPGGRNEVLVDLKTAGLTAEATTDNDRRTGTGKRIEDYGNAGRARFDEELG